VKLLRQCAHRIVDKASTSSRTFYAQPDDTSPSSTWDGQQQIHTTYTYRPDGKLTQVQRAATCIYATSAKPGLEFRMERFE